MLRKALKEETIIGPASCVIFSSRKLATNFLNQGGNAALMDAPIIEVQDVQRGCPGVSTSLLPIEPEQQARYVSHFWPLDTFRVTEVSAWVRSRGRGRVLWLGFGWASELARCEGEACADNTCAARTKEAISWQISDK